jgi:hypothetical protein
VALGVAADSDIGRERPESVIALNEAGDRLYNLGDAAAR